MDCKVCESPYDLKDHLPMRLTCGHEYCKECIQSLINHNNVAKCSQCQQTDRRDLEQIPLSNNIIEALKKMILYCREHNTEAVGYNASQSRPICVLCNQISVDPKTIPFLIGRNLYLYFMQNKHLFSQELRLIIRSSMKEKLQSQYDLVCLIKLYIAKGHKCTVHPNQDAVSINTKIFTLACQSCHDNENMQFNINNINLFIKYYLDTFVYNKQRADLVFSKVTMFLRNATEYFAQPFIELYLMEKYYDSDYSRYGCLSCGRLFHLGMRMPVLLNCGHLLCFKCSLSVSNCEFCGQGVVVFLPKPIQNLYTAITCARCQSENEKISYENLPFHGACDCILCARCIKSSNCCRKCLPEGVTRDQYDIKVNRRALQTCHYLDTNINCDSCNSTRAFYFKSSEPFSVLCQSCIQGNENLIILSNYYQLELFLLSFDTYVSNMAGYGNSPAYYYAYAGLPLALKIHIITSFYNQNIRSRSIEYPFLRIQELKRFDRVYPTSVNDSRKYTVSKGQYIGLTISTNIEFKLCGLILGGRIDLGNLNITVYICDSLNQIKQTLEIKAFGKEILVMLQNIPQATFITIIVGYTESYSLFCGKLAQTNVIEQGGITWQLSDPYRMNNDLSGPILGILYSQDF